MIGAATAQGSAEPGFRSQRLGDIEVITLNDGVIRFPLREGWIRNASTEQTRAALRAADLEDTRIDLPFTVTALRLRDRIALVDTGTGGFPIYGPTLGMAARSMAAAGIERSMVDSVLISHLHGDHIYGLMDRDTLAPLYPNAEIIVYCKVGNRTGLTVKALKEAGYRRVVGLQGGFDEWVKQGNAVHNYLGEFMLVKPKARNAASLTIDFYESKQ